MTFYRDVLSSPVGEMILTATEDGLISIIFSSGSHGWDGVRTPDSLGQHPVLKKAFKQLSDYFTGKRKTFNLTLHPVGTSFQLAVWQQIIGIPYGQTCSYREIALALGNRNKARAVGQAANRNPLPIVIPCHRVIGAGGKLTGFAGGLARKSYLLNLERGLLKTELQAG